MNFAAATTNKLLKLEIIYFRVSTENTCTAVFEIMYRYFETGEIIRNVNKKQEQPNCMFQKQIKTRRLQLKV